MNTNMNVGALIIMSMLTKTETGFLKKNPKFKRKPISKPKASFTFVNGAIFMPKIKANYLK